MEAETRTKIEETVIDILKKANMEEMTEFKVRASASERLGIELSNIVHKRLVRSVIEKFLLSGSEERGESNVGEETKEVVREEQQGKMKREVNEDGDRVICKLSNKRSVAIQDFKGRTFVSIREYYQKHGKQLPSAKGISLTAEQWSAFKKSVPAIEEAIMKMESKLRSDVKQTEDVSSSRTTFSEDQRKQTEDASNPVSASTPHELVRIEINRFNGKNYHCWAQQMEYFLKQSKIAYVLTNPCPSVTLSSEASVEELGQAKAAEQKWVNDDYICRRNILNSLSDNLYYKYSKETKNAKELWEELKLVYIYEEFGAKRAQVRKYIEFQMVDEKPIVDQVQELNKIADFIVASGMLIDENFHVSVIISKLPPSWKDFCIKLMHVEYLSFWTLMDRLRVEEESRNQDKQERHSNLVNFHLAQNLGPRTRDMKRPGIYWKKQDSEMDGKVVVCYTCGKKGHISRHCRGRKFDKEMNEKRDEDNASAPAVTEVNMVDEL